MTGKIDIEVDSYENLLYTLAAIEKEENDMRNKKGWAVLIGALSGIAIVIIMMTAPNSKLSFIELITTYGSAISLGPVFGFMYYSTQAEMLSNRKQQFWISLSTLFNSAEKLNLAEVKKLLEEKLKEKLNENLKYDY